MPSGCLLCILSIPSTAHHISPGDELLLHDLAQPKVAYFDAGVAVCCHGVGLHTGITHALCLCLAPGEAKPR